MRDSAHIPGMGWWPPKLRLKQSDLCSECNAIDFTAVFTPPQDYESEEKPWILLVEREQLVIDSNCALCRYFSHICYSIHENGIYFIAFHERLPPHDKDCNTQHGNACRSLDKILISVLRTRHINNVLECFSFHPFGGRYDGILRQKSGFIVCHLNKPTREPRTPQIVPNALDVSLAKAWLDLCTRQHGACRCAINTRLHMPRTKLIDCKARKLIKVGVWPFHMPRFAALSYRWGVTPEPQMEQDREGHLSNLPLTIEDAISVTKGLGMRYLWVDQYCIDQSNSKEKQEQIQKMDRIYQCADVTIMATAGNDCHYGLPGVSKRARQVLDPFILDDTLTFGICPAAGAHWQNGAWHERGWTFQETHLARRRLVFSDTLVHFECSHHKPWQRENSGGFETVQHNAKETRKLREGYAALALDIRQVLDTWDLCEISPIISTVSLQRVAAYVHHGNFEACIIECYSFVTHYTMRKLSYTSDALNAFLGLANAMQELRSPVYNVVGVPFMVGNKRTGRDYWAEFTFSYGLAWYSREGMDRSDQQVAENGGFPSWSWGNVKLWPVLFDYLAIDKPGTPRPPPKDPKNCHIIYNAQLRDIQVEFTSDGKKEIIGLVRYAEMSGKARKMSLPQPTALLFKARFVPSHAIGLRSEDGNTEQNGTGTFSGKFFHDAHGSSESLTISLVEDTSNETDSSERDSQAESQPPGWEWNFTTYPRYRLLVHDRQFHHDITASGWSLLLLRCFYMSTGMLNSVRLLVIKGMEGNSASRVGIVTVRPDSHRFSDRLVEAMFVKCFTFEREVRLV